MDIRMIRRVKARDVINETLAKYGDRKTVEEVARKDIDSDANHALHWFQLADEDPTILDEWSTQHVLLELPPDEVRLLTGTRIALLETIMRLERPSITELQQESKRDYKRVQNDVNILEQIGFVRTEKEGRRRIVHAEGSGMVIEFTPSGEETVVPA